MYEIKVTALEFYPSDEAAVPDSVLAWLKIDGRESFVGFGIDIDENNCVSMCVSDEYYPDSFGTYTDDDNSVMETICALAGLDMVEADDEDQDKYFEFKEQFDAAVDDLIRQIAPVVMTEAQEFWNMRLDEDEYELKTPQQRQAAKLLNQDWCTTYAFQSIKEDHGYAVVYDSDGITARTPLTQDLAQELLAVEDNCYKHGYAFLGDARYLLDFMDTVKQAYQYDQGRAQLDLRKREMQENMQALTASQPKEDSLNAGLKNGGQGRH